MIAERPKRRIGPRLARAGGVAGGFALAIGLATGLWLAAMGLAAIGWGALGRPALEHAVAGGAQDPATFWLAAALAALGWGALVWAALAFRAAQHDQDRRIARLQDSLERLHARAAAQPDPTLPAALPDRADPPQPAPPAPAAGADDGPGTARAVFVTARAGGSAQAAARAAMDFAVQPHLSLEPQPRTSTRPPAPADLIRALHFPEDPQDRAGFDALHSALAWHGTGQLVRSAQEVLTALAEDGIFMDDLHPDRARPDLWRAFAGGTRGPAMAVLAGVRDRPCLSLAMGRMRQDPAFRNIAHRFLRSFDDCLTQMAPALDDTSLARLMDTRSARAFMLLGRVTGVFGR